MWADVVVVRDEVKRKEGNKPTLIISRWICQDASLHLEIRRLWEEDTFTQGQRIGLDGTPKRSEASLERGVVR